MYHSTRIRQHLYVCIHKQKDQNLQTARTHNTAWRGVIGCLIFIGHFPQNSPIISGSFAKNDLQVEASYDSTAPCTAQAQQAPHICMHAYLQQLIRTTHHAYIFIFACIHPTFFLDVLLLLLAKYVCVLAVCCMCCSVLQCVASQKKKTETCKLLANTMTSKHCECQMRCDCHNAPPPNKHQTQQHHTNAKNSTC